MIWHLQFVKIWKILLIFGKLLAGMVTFRFLGDLKDHFWRKTLLKRLWSSLGDPVPNHPHVCRANTGTFLGKPSKKNKKCWFFPHWGGGSTPNPHFFKSVDFQGGVGGLGSNFHTFLSNFIFFKEFFPILSSFCGLEGGGVQEVWKKSTLFIIFFFEGFPKLLCTKIVDSVSHQ